MNIRHTPQLAMLMLCAGGVYADDILNLQGVSGEIGYQYRTIETEHYSMNANHLQGTINTRGYLWQPWFVTARAGVTIAYHESDSDNNSSEQQLYSGHLNLTALPLSRFPLNLYVSRSDNYLENSPSTIAALSSGTASLDQHHTTTQISLLQKYLGKRTRTELFYNSTETEIDERNADTHSFGVSHNYGILHHRFNFKTTASESSSDDGIITNTTTALATHRYSNSSRLAINTEVSSTESDYSRINTQGAESYQTTTTVSQANSNLNFYSENRKLHTNASLRFIDFKQHGSSNNALLDTYSKSTHAAIHNSYRFNDYVSGTLGGTTSTTENASSTVRQSSQKAALSARTPRYQVWSHDYGLNGSTGVNYTQNDGVKNRHVSASAGHGANRQFSLARIPYFFHGDYIVGAT